MSGLGVDFYEWRPQLAACQAVSGFQHPGVESRGGHSPTCAHMVGSSK
jgi:hypothetical protein